MTPASPAPPMALAIPGEPIGPRPGAADGRRVEGSALLCYPGPHRAAPPLANDGATARWPRRLCLLRCCAAAMAPEGSERRVAAWPRWTKTSGTR